MTTSTRPCAAAPAIFHSSAKAVVLFAGPLGVILGVLLVFIDEGLKVDVSDLAIGIAGGVVAVVVQSFLACRRYTIELSEAGIRAYSFWGKRRFIKWQEIEAVRPFTLLNLRYLRLYGPQPSKPLWLAIFIPNPSAFRDAITRLAPINCPVLDHIK